MKRWAYTELDSPPGNQVQTRKEVRHLLRKGWRLVQVVSKEKEPGNQLCVRYYLTKRLTRKEYRNNTYNV